MKIFGIKFIKDDSLDDDVKRKEVRRKDDVKLDIKVNDAKNKFEASMAELELILKGRKEKDNAA